MPVANRAKQFMPFAAVKGLNEALRAKERELCLTDKKELADDGCAELEAHFEAVRKGTNVTAVYFCGGEYLTASGSVTLCDTVNRILRVGDSKISFDDIFELEIE